MRVADARSVSLAWHHRGDEQVRFPPFPGERYPSSGHPLPDLPPHRRVPARRSQRGLDRALPPGPPRSARPAVPVTVRGGDTALISLFRKRPPPRTTLPRPDPGKAGSRSVIVLRCGPARDPPARSAGCRPSHLSCYRTGETGASAAGSQHLDCAGSALLGRGARPWSWPLLGRSYVKIRCGPGQRRRLRPVPRRRLAAAMARTRHDRAF